MGKSPKNGEIPKKSRKSREGQKRTNRDGRVQIGKRPRLKSPCLAALDFPAIAETSLHLVHCTLGPRTLHDLQRPLPLLHQDLQAHATQTLVVRCCAGVEMQQAWPHRTRQSALLPQCSLKFYGCNFSCLQLHELPAYSWSFFAWSCVWKLFCLELEFIYLQLELFGLQSSFVAYSGKARLRSTSTDCKQESSSASKKAPTASKKFTQIYIAFHRVAIQKVEGQVQRRTPEFSLACAQSACDPVCESDSTYRVVECCTASFAPSPLKTH